MQIKQLFKNKEYRGIFQQALQEHKEKFLMGYKDLAKQCLKDEKVDVETYIKNNKWDDLKNILQAEWNKLSNEGRNSERGKDLMKCIINSDYLKQLNPGAVKASEDASNRPPSRP